MKKGNFNIGDKVFAKVKGYPAWPAVILEENGKKYKVKFYGTGEIGQIKSDDLFYYTRNKAKLLKPSKRKDFNDSVKEIEEEIAKCGTDGDPNYGHDNNESIVSDSSLIADSDSSISKKRKRSISAKSVEESPAQRPKKGRPPKVTTGNVSPIIEDKSITPVPEKQEEQPELKDKKEEKAPTPIKPEEKENITEEIVPDEAKTEEPLEEVTETNEKDEISVNIPGVDDFVQEKELEALIAFGEHVNKHKDVYKKMPVQELYCSKVQVLPFITQEKCIGIKLHEKWCMDEFKNEYDTAIYLKEASERVIRLKHSFKLEDLEKQPELYFSDLETTEEELKNLWDKKLTKIQEEILENLKIESKLTEIDSKIKSCLNLEKADPKEGIKLLNEMSEIQITAVMLKKHVHIVDMVRRLKKYVGNLERWNLTDDDTNNFNKDAEMIRNAASKLHAKFMRIVGKPSSNQSFWDFFNDIATKFREDTKELSEMEFYLLTDWPYTRENFMNYQLIKDLSFSGGPQEEKIVTDEKV